MYTSPRDVSLASLAQWAHDLIRELKRRDREAQPPVPAGVVVDWTGGDAPEGWAIYMGDPARIVKL